ncbi:MAG: hypothetical protein LBP86_11335 [Azoarcus sp.]|nr:hypothetical protein [Azoarcus sp.]
MMTDFYRKRIAGLAIQLATEDPLLVKEVIDRLRQAGEIESGDLTYLEGIADRWIKIAQDNLAKGQRRQVAGAVSRPSPPPVPR